MELNNIWAHVGDRDVFSGLTLKSQARHVGIIGRNGSGKTSLLRLLQGLLVPSKGDVVLDQPVGLVFQNPDQQLLFPTVLEELTFSATQDGVAPDQAKQAALEFARQYNAESLLRLATHELSAGQKTLVCLMAVLIDSPKTLLLDESFANLDLIAAQRLTALVLNSSLRVIFSTHQTHLLTEFDEVIWLENGQVHDQGPPGRVIQAYEDWCKARC